MAEVTRRSWLAGAGLAALTAGFGGATAAARKASQLARPKISPRELIQQRHLPDLQLITQHGKKVRFYRDLIKDKKVVINFMYANCEKSCPLITTNLVRVQKMLHNRVGRDIFFYSITLKPEEDTPKALKRYAETHHVGPGWLFLTGKPEEIERLRRALGFTWSNPAEDADKSTHISMVRMGNEEYMRWAACPGEASAKWIATTILAEMDGPLKGGLIKGHTTV